jgi:predicted ATPase
MVKRLTLRNFKGWQQLEGLEFADITVLFGTNSSGKTSILQSLLMLKQTSESYDRKRAMHFGGSPKDYVDLGSFGDIVYRGDVTKPIEVELDWDTVDGPDFGVEPTGPKAIRYQAKWELADDEVVVSHLIYAAGKRTFGLSREPDGRYLSRIEGFTRRRGKPSQWPMVPESCYALPLQARREVQKADPLEFSHQFELFVGRVRYLGPLREFPQRLYRWTGEAPLTVDPRGSNAVDVLLATATEGRPRGGKRARRQGVMAKVQNWLQRLELADTFELRSISRDALVYEAKVRPREAPYAAMISDVGFGVSQVLPVVVLLLSVPEHSIVLLEQPEIHLHPSVEANLADLFLEVAHERSLQLIIESHSEYLLRRLQRRIAENQLAFAHPDHVRLYFCTVGDEGCEIEHVRTDLFGNIENWPEGFFGHDLVDLDAMTKAELARRKEEAARAGGGS